LPVRQPDYRGGRDHASFLTNLSVQAPLLRRYLCDAWECVTKCVSWPSDLVRQLITDRYLRAEWVERC
jgi:lipoate-protein ligase A